MRKSFASRALGLLPLTLIFGSSCSLVYDLSPDQCGNNTDCVRMFGQGFVCNEGLCECPEGASCDKGTGGTGGTAGDAASGGTGETSGVGGTAAMGGDAGMMESGGVGGASGGRASGGKGGTSAGRGGNSTGGTTGGTTGGSTAEGGAAGMVESCSTHSECLALHPEAPIDPYVCVDSRCVRLKSEDCPVVLPISDNNDYESLDSTNAIIVGAFAPLLGDLTEPISRNYDLAIDELHQKAHGVKPGTTDRREIVMVVCQSFLPKADLKRAAQHLVDDLQVPGIVASLTLEDQQYVVEEVTEPAGVFMMMSLYSDQALIDRGDGGLVWHMLSGANALSVSFQPLLDMTEQHLKNLGSLGGSEDMKVLLIKATDEGFTADTATYLVDHLNFNGQNVLDNDTDGLFKQILVESSYADPTGDRAQAIADILAFQPHVVIGSNISEVITKIIPGVEAGWDAATSGKDRPFYLLGALTYTDPDMDSLMINDKSVMNGQVPLHQRVLGLGWPAAEDPLVYQKYLTRYADAYGTAVPFFENFYDSAYNLIYGIAAAKVPLNGDKIATGMLRVTTGTTEVEVGPSDDMETYINQLGTSSTKIKLIGAMGPPAWDENGARLDPGSVWCVKGGGVFVPDRFRFNPVNSQLEGVGTSECDWTFPAP